MIDADVKISESKAPAVFAEIQKGTPQLKKAETKDMSAPVIDQETKIGEAPQKVVFSAIAPMAQTA